MSTTEDIIAKADAFHKAEDIHANFKTLEEAYASGNQDPEILWRLGRACYDQAQETTDKAEKQKHITRALELEKAAVEQLPNNFAAQKWCGIVLSATGEFIPTKEKIANAYIIRDHFLKATELNPNDCTSAHCLGKWCWSVLQIGWIERQAASLLFGTPPTSTYEECEEYLLKSAKLEMNQVYNNLLLGDLYYQQKKWADAKKWYQHAIECPVVTENQKRQHEEAKAKLAKC